MGRQDRNGARRQGEDGAALAAGLVELESIYNGPIPEPARSIARLGSPALLLRLRVEAEVAFFTAMTRGQLTTIRRRRADGSFYPALLDDLSLYRRHRRAWRSLAAALETREAPPAEGGASDRWLNHHPILDRV